ncbi:O-acyltransferase like protein-like [Glandiceps talaboti]
MLLTLLFVGVLRLSYVTSYSWDSDFLHLLGDQLTPHRHQEKLYQTYSEYLVENHGDELFRFGHIIDNAIVRKQISGTGNRFSVDQSFAKSDSLQQNAMFEMTNTDIDLVYSIVNVTEECLISTQQLLHDFRSSPAKRYALEMADAAAKIESNILRGNIRWLGLFSACRSITDIPVTKDPSMTFDAQYCLVNTLIRRSSGIDIPIQLAVCLPDTCTDDDVTDIATVGLEVMRPFILLNNLDAVSSYCDYNIPLSAGAITMICILSILVLLVVCGSVCDNLLRRRYLKENKACDENVAGVSVPTGLYVVRQSIVDSSSVADIKTEGAKDDGNDNTATKKWRPLLAFSVYLNGDDLLNTKPDHGEESLRCVHGMKILSLMWVMYAMNYEISATLSTNPTDYGVGSFIGQPISDASWATDTFFVISGMLVTYWSLKKLDEEDGKINWLLFYFHKFWRIFPLYYFVLFSYMYCLVYTSMGPMKYLLDNTLDECYSNWWTNVLFIQNFHPYFDAVRVRCMGWSWFICIMVQFYLITPIIIALLNWRKWAGFTAIGCLFMVDFVCTILITGYWGLPVSTSLDAFNNRSDEHFLGDYIDTKPQTRIATYLVGMCLGYIIVKEVFKDKKLNNWVLACGWIVSFVFGFFTVYGKYWALNGDPWSQAASICWHTFSRLLFSLAVAWCLFACIHGYGGAVNKFLSWKFFIPISRLVYCLYLIHPILMIKFLLGSENQIFVVDINFLYLFVGHLIFGFFMAFWLCLIIERPFMKLERLMFGRDLRDETSG